LEVEAGKEAGKEAMGAVEAAAGKEVGKEPVARAEAASTSSFRCLDKAKVEVVAKEVGWAAERVAGRVEAEWVG